MPFPVNNTSPLQVLIVDDSPQIVSRLQRLLEPHTAVQVSGTATSFTQALEALNELKPHVVILDINLASTRPGENGMGILLELAHSHPATQAVMLSNLSSEAYRSKCRDLGAKYFLDKSSEFEKVPEVLLQIARS